VLRDSILLVGAGRGEARRDGILEDRETGRVRALEERPRVMGPGAVTASAPAMGSEACSLDEPPPAGLGVGSGLESIERW
jgi:hypothetical protein